MRCAAVFLIWAMMMACYLVAGARLIPAENQVVYRLSPKDPESRWLNILWWGVSLSWLAEPSIPWGPNWSVGALLFVFGSALVIWARRVNPFFLPVIRKPGCVVIVGPYRRLKHPGYVGFVSMAFGSLLMLGHWNGIVPLVCYAALLVVRARRENRLLAS